jgi:hypothetical protein
MVMHGGQAEGAKNGPFGFICLPVSNVIRIKLLKIHGKIEGLVVFEYVLRAIVKFGQLLLHARQKTTKQIAMLEVILSSTLEVAARGRGTLEGLMPHESLASNGDVVKLGAVKLSMVFTGTILALDVIVWIGLLLMPVEDALVVIVVQLALPKDAKEGLQVQLHAVGVCQ